MSEGNDPGHRFAELLSQVAREITLKQAAEVCCGDLTLEQFQTLRVVRAWDRASDRMSLSSLSAQLRVDLSTMSRNVTLLERNGYLLRARSADDGRIVNVGITPKGKRALETLRCDERDLLAEIYERLPPGDRGTIVRALEVIRTCLDRPAAGTGAPCCPPANAGKCAP